MFLSFVNNLNGIKVSNNLEKIYSNCKYSIQVKEIEINETQANYQTTNNRMRCGCDGHFYSERKLERSNKTD